MSKLSTEQINELKNKGFITQVVSSSDLADNTVDELKDLKYITVTDPSANIENAVSHGIPVEGISIPDTLDIEYGSDGSFTVIFTPEDATNKNVTVVSSDPDVVTVDHYDPDNQYVLLMAGEVGEAVITVTTEDGGFTTECYVYVIDPVIPVEGVEITNEETSVSIGGNLLIEYSITPDDATNKNVTVVSSDENVFTVQYNGKREEWKLYGVSAGTATLTVTTKDGGYTDTAEITVNEI